MPANGAAAGTQWTQAHACRTQLDAARKREGKKTHLSGHGVDALGSAARVQEHPDCARYCGDGIDAGR